MQILDNGIYTEISSLAIPTTLPEYKVWKIEKIYQQCLVDVETGFTSESTGYSFPLNKDYMDNFTQAGVAFSLDDELISVPFNTSNMGLKFLTREQFKAIFKEGKAHKESLLMIYFQLKAGVEVSESIEQASIYNWV